uniref:Pescadillo homolog n=3 Tax=Heterorhabditis TaxID=37861 RepID=A0A1I7X4J9_HETBA
MKVRVKKKYEAGAAVNYISRRQALKKLQLSLKDFRRLCILKGIYPHEPAHKKQVNKGSTENRVWYYRKDINFLAHEPIINKFREYKVFLKKLNHYKAKREESKVKKLYENKPEYSLDRIVKERFNTFISIKGIYYQAEICGEKVTWVVPHDRGLPHVSDVDFTVMFFKSLNFYVTFAEFYVSMLGFVNFRLYQMIGLYYPPQIQTGQNIIGSNNDDEEYIEKVYSLARPLAKRPDADKDQEEEDHLDIYGEDNNAMAEKIKEGKVIRYVRCYANFKYPYSIEKFNVGYWKLFLLVLSYLDVAPLVASLPPTGTKPKPKKVKDDASLEINQQR